MLLVGVLPDAKDELLAEEWLSDDSGLEPRDEPLRDEDARDGVDGVAFVSLEDVWRNREGLLPRDCTKNM